MNVYEVINKAADHIEQYPERFDFWTVYPPKGPEEKGCAIAWIGYFAGANSRELCSIAREVLGVSDGEFYYRMHDVSPHRSWNWRYDTALCAAALRQYAEVYHHAEKPKVVPPLAEPTPRRTGIPAAIKAFFTTKEPESV